MSAQQDPNHDLIHPVPTGAAQSGQTGQSHQYPAITLDGNSSAQFGDVYHQYYGECTSQDARRAERAGFMLRSDS